MTRPTPLPATKLLLALLAQTGQAAIDFYSFLYDARHYRGAYMRGGHGLVKELKQLKNKRRAQQMLERLRQAQYLKTQKIGKRLMVALTQKGVAASLVIQLQQAPRRPDSLYTVVIFDIPETQRSARRQLRLLLRQGGFAKLQQSVWVSQKDAHKLVTKFVQDTSLGAWVNVFLASAFLRPPK